MSDPTNPDKLLPGEAAAAASASREEAEHWVEVYTELFGFKRDLMNELQEQRRRVKAEGQSEVESDNTMFKREADRLERRLQFWQAQLKGLGSE